MDKALAGLFIPNSELDLTRIDEPTCTDALLAQTEPFFDVEEYDRDYIRRQKAALIEEAARERKKEMNKRVLCFGAWFTVFGLLMSGVVFLATRRNIPSSIKEVIEQGQDEHLKDWSVNMGIMECHRLAKKSILFQSDVKNENLSSLSFKSPAVFILKDYADLTMEEACGLESFAHILAELMVYAVQLKCDKSPSGPPTNKYKHVLTDSYKNIMAINVDGKTFFESTPLSGRWHCGSNLAVQQAMLLTAWRYGGLVVHPGVAITRRSFIHFPAGQIYFSGQYVVSYKSCDPSVYYLLTVLAKQPKQETVFDISKRAKEIFDSLCCGGVCPDVVVDDGTKVCDTNCPLVLVSNSTDLSKLCPHIWKALDDSLRTSGG